MELATEEHQFQVLYIDMFMTKEEEQQLEPTKLLLMISENVLNDEAIEDLEGQQKRSGQRL
ncbi:hypothetical protein Hypma_002429 [Hypsizygus marmoreus]|uniref:Uncharacterized protein n=1 Tax=Hypsizygus marmoreus TaxID=39966 RepID=A0A369J4D7_HYPMA|nr:hypothetical protein Hypma_002429 [Hypsizygus marmoreus]